MTTDEIRIYKAEPKDAEAFLNVAASVDLAPNRLNLGDSDDEIGFLRTYWSDEEKKDKLVEIFKTELEKFENVLCIKKDGEVIGHLTSWTAVEHRVDENNTNLLRKIKWFYGTENVQNIIEGDNWVMLNRICIQKDNIRKGIGKKLLLGFIERMKKQGYSNVFAYVTVFPIRNEASLNFLRKFKFQDVGEFSEEFDYNHFGKRVFIERLFYRQIDGRCN